MTTTANNTAGQEIPPAPDLRQSMCHTLMAAGFVILLFQNPFTVDNLEGNFHSWIAVALVAGVILSWYLFSKRLMAWRKVPAAIRARVTRRPRDLKQRAFSHLLMSLLAGTLTALGYLSRLALPHDHARSLTDYLLLGASGLVGILAVAVLARTLRDLFAARRLRKPPVR